MAENLGPGGAHCHSAGMGVKLGWRKKKVKTYLSSGAGALASEVSIGVGVCSAN